MLVSSVQGMEKGYDSYVKDSTRKNEQHVRKKWLLQKETWKQ